MKKFQLHRMGYVSKNWGVRICRLYHVKGSHPAVARQD